MIQEEEAAAAQRLSYKVVLLGDAAVGKTSLIRQLVQSKFLDEYQPTVGVEFYKAELCLHPKRMHATLQLWDVGSHVRSLQMAANYLQGSDAVVVVYDITQHETYTAALSWLDIVQQMFQETGVPLVALVGNKADTADLQAAAAQLTVPQAAPGSLSCCCASYPAVSAKTGHNVQHMAASISAQLAGVPVQLPPAAKAVDVLEAAAAAHSSRKQTRHQPLTRLLRRVLGHALCCCCMR